MQELELWDYRRRMAAIYHRVLGDPGEAAWRRWRQEREELMRTHPQSPFPPERRTDARLRSFDHDPAWRVTAELRPDPEPPAQLGGETPFRRFARAVFASPGGPLELAVYWLEAYGGGVFVPFGDATNGAETYGGGRYLLDTAKGADLGHEGSRVVLDFNYAYHPSCVHDERWTCPLAPPENRLPVPVRAGECFA